MPHRYLLTAISLLVFAAFTQPSPAADAPAERPNFLWITLEDISPNVGCYGDAYAITPNIDALAKRGVRYTRAFAPIGVCAPTRSTLITGVYAPSIGTHPMRSQGTLPDLIQCFPRYLREAGYYCTNNVKTDYNFKHAPESWDENSNKAHWRNRGKDQPFFAVFNLTTCHESQIRLPETEYQRRMATLKPSDKHDPSKATVPPYQPDTPEVRKDWARYADMITYTDRRIGEILQELADDGLADDTIVFCFSDHGAGMPRSKRWLYDSSLRVPFVVHFPKKFEALAPAMAGGTEDRMISLVDVAPTMLSLVGLAPKPHMQGTAFLGKFAGPPRQYVHGFRDRMDERTDMIRGVRDERYKYIRNYYPHLPWFRDQFLSYGWEMPTLRVWQQLAEAGKLQGDTATFMAREKPTEELYDLKADPNELHNLASDPKHRDTLDRLRNEMHRWQDEIIDLGFLPEADLRTRFGTTPQYMAVREHPEHYPLSKIRSAAELAGDRNVENLPKLGALLNDNDPAIRFWGATGIGALSTKLSSNDADARDKAIDLLSGALDDQAGWVRVAAAAGLGRYEQYDRAVPVLRAAMGDANPWVRHQASEALDRIDKHAMPAVAELRRGLSDDNEYVIRVVTHALEELGEKRPPTAAKGKKAGKNKAKGKNGAK